MSGNNNKQSVNLLIANHLIVFLLEFFKVPIQTFHT